MKIIKTISVALVFFFFTITFSHSADVAKIGIVDFKRIFETSEAGKKAQIEINKQGKKMEQDLKEKGASIENLKKRLEQEALVMSKEMREEKGREIRIKINDIKMLQEKYLTDFRKLENKLISTVRNDVFGIIEKIGKREGYLLIIEKRGVLYSPNALDITDQIIQKHNDMFVSN